MSETWTAAPEGVGWYWMRQGVREEIVYFGGIRVWRFHDPQVPLDALLAAEPGTRFAGPLVPPEEGPAETATPVRAHGERIGAPGEEAR